MVLFYILQQNINVELHIICMLKKFFFNFSNLFQADAAVFDLIFLGRNY